MKGIAQWKPSCDHSRRLGSENTRSNAYVVVGRNLGDFSQEAIAGPRWSLSLINCGLLMTENRMYVESTERFCIEWPGRGADCRAAGSGPRKATHGYAGTAVARPADPNPTEQCSPNENPVPLRWHRPRVGVLC